MRVSFPHLESVGRNIEWAVAISENRVININISIMIGVSFKTCHVTVSFEPGDKNENISRLCSAQLKLLSGVRRIGWKWSTSHFPSSIILMVTSH